ncbi:MAG: protein kinase, partial [Candidatus Dormibacteraeota bacterium]|nr:protein kinase [Candidatus Dormibacteraeota bacterium]MBO0762465.1 protein kinase [Candidatus Dormibacteraeota bacterium]
MAQQDLEGTAFGRYQVAERLGAGHLSVVYRATDRETQREVALKVLDPAVSARPGFLPRFRAAVHNLTRAGDPGILPVYDAGSEHDLTYVSLRLVKGTTLRERLAGGPLDFPFARALVRVVGQAVHAANEAGVLHQDLKPGNVLLDGGKAVQVADFGLVPLRYGYALGTPGYMSPEQALGRELDRRSDVHALAQLVFEMVTGRRPYTGETPPELMVATVSDPVPSARGLAPDLPPELDAVLARGLAKDPRDRPATAAQFLDELGRVPARIGGHPEDEGELLALIEATPGPVLALDPDGRVTEWNRGAEVAFGWTREDMLGEPALTRLIATAHRERFEHVVQEALRSPAPPEPGRRSVEVEAAHRDGHTIALDVSPAHQQTGDGTGNLVLFCRDVSPRRESDRLVRMQAAVARALSERPVPEELARQVLDAMCSELGWSAAAVWRPDRVATRLQCLSFWHAPALTA